MWHQGLSASMNGPVINRNWDVRESNYYFTNLCYDYFTGKSGVDFPPHSTQIHVRVAINKNSDWNSWKNVEFWLTALLLSLGDTERPKFPTLAPQKGPWIGSHKTKEMYSLTVPEAKSSKSRHQQGHASSETSVQIPSCLFQLLLFVIKFYCSLTCSYVCLHHHRHSFSVSFMAVFVWNESWWIQTHPNDLA